jgi:hypothetical protein
MTDNQRNPMPVETRTETMMRLYRKALGPRPENMWVFLWASLAIDVAMIVTAGFLHSDVTESTDWPSDLFSKERVGS